MALARRDNGQFVIKTKSEAQRALAMMVELEAEIRQIQEETGLDEMMVDSVELKKAATAYCAENNIEVLPVKGTKKIAKLVRSVGSRRWIGTKADAAEADVNVKPLKSLVSKETWMAITKRVPDPDLINQAVEEGVVKLEDISPAYVETYRAPYLRLVDNGSEET